MKVTGANTSGDTVALNTPRTVKIDISNIAPRTVAIYFDLLGLGAKDGKVIIDNVMLLDKDLINPIAIAVTATTDQAQRLVILANDSDAKALSTLAPCKLVLHPANGKSVTVYQ